MSIAPSTNRGAVVITGASTGIGRACALHLDELGFQVFAGVRREADGAALRREASERLVPLFVDVTDSAAIATAAEVVAAAVGEAGLAGLVNNAGIAVAGPLEAISIEDLRRQLEVNVIGHVAVIQAFLPLLRRARGRIVNMGSISGRLTTPFTGPYCASKAALEALTAALRMELQPWGLAVSIIEPGVVATPILRKSVNAAEAAVRSLPEHVRELYRPTVATLRQKTAGLGRAATPVGVVARAVAHALTARRPRLRYVVGWDARLVELVRSVPEWIRERLILWQLGLKSVEP